ncbi:MULTISPECIES: hypothetical protein [Pantoea]|uniref:hypothetical protein n=1 Tax=Pantoea TaxID=53335 RepID=UPI001F2B8512|nr:MULTISPECIES: hypothetical protein [Pantoea]UIL54208.1 hypothetical protein LZU96_09875 [Pantoea agglomerans]
MIIIPLHFDGGSTGEEHDIAHIASSIVARLLAGFFFVIRFFWRSVRHHTAAAPLSSGKKGTGRCDIDREGLRSVGICTG